jgi:hypothetical protein
MVLQMKIPIYMFWAFCGSICLGCGTVLTYQWNMSSVTGLKAEAAYSSEILVSTDTNTWCHNLKGTMLRFPRLNCFASFVILSGTRIATTIFRKVCIGHIPCLAEQNSPCYLLLLVWYFCFTDVTLLKFQFLACCVCSCQQVAQQMHVCGLM